MSDRTGAKKGASTESEQAETQAVLPWHGGESHGMGDDSPRQMLHGIFHDRGVGDAVSDQSFIGHQLSHQFRNFEISVSISSSARMSYKDMTRAVIAGDAKIVRDIIYSAAEGMADYRDPKVWCRRYDKKTIHFNSHSRSPRTHYMDQ